MKISPSNVFRLALALLPSVALADTRVPTIDEMVALKRVSQPAMSPDGSRVAYVVRKANWDENAFETEIWLADVKSGASRVFTQSKKSSDAPSFSPDGSTLGFLSDREGKRQVYVMSLVGGESRKLTSAEEGVNRFAWSHDGKRIAFVASDPKTDAMKEKQKLYGDVTVEDEATNPAHLHVINVESGATKRLTSGTFVVNTFDWSPDDREIAFDFTQSTDPVGAGISNWITYYVSTDIHPFTRQYLKATPWDDPEIYRKTSPMTYIKGAKAPTLIQHGDADQRVPVSDAFELYQGLRDQGVPTRLVLYKGFGHGINKPKALRNAMQENLDWFDQHLFGAPSAK